MWIKLHSYGRNLSPGLQLGTNLQTRKWLSCSGVFQNLLVEKIESAPLQDKKFDF